MKRCTKCGENKNLSEFYKNKNTGDGYNCWCKKCCNIYSKKYREENPGKREESQRKYRENNPEKVKAAIIQWQKENPERNRENYKQWKENNPEKVKEYRKKYYKNNKEKVLKRNKKWRDNNPEIIKENDRKWRKRNPGKARKYRKKSKAKRKRELGYEELFPNPFKGSIHWHHTDNKYVVALPVNTHRQFYCGLDKETHRAMLEPIVYEIYYKQGEAI